MVKDDTMSHVFYNRAGVPIHGEVAAWAETLNINPKRRRDPANSG
jgi:hypothetical protein